MIKHNNLKPVIKQLYIIYLLCALSPPPPPPKMGSDESHFNVSVGSDGQSHKTVSTDKPQPF